jgi:hypothetical protein
VSNKTCRFGVNFEFGAIECAVDCVCTLDLIKVSSFGVAAALFNLCSRGVMFESRPRSTAMLTSSVSPGRCRYSEWKRPLLLASQSSL